MPRSHFYSVAQDVAGNAIEHAVIRILQPGTENPIAAPIYATDTDVAAMPNPFTTISGEVSVYVDTPQRVRLGITPPGAVERFVNDIDIGLAIAAGGDSTHVGGGSSSTKVGLDAVSDGAQSLAIAQQATSGGIHSVAAGFAAAAGGPDSTALGSATVASGDRALAAGRLAGAIALGTTAIGAGASGSNTRATSVGDTAVANSIRATALGANSTAGHDHATAVGSESVTTEPNQVMLGTAADFAESPGGYLLVAADGKRGRLRMLPDGSLTTIWHVPSNAVNLLPVDEQGFEAGIGAWAAVSGLTVAQSPDYAVSGTKSLKATLTGAAAASARSGKVAAVTGTVYVGQARMFFHAGAMTANLDGTAWLEFYDAGNVIIGTATIGRSRKYFADCWIYFDARAVAPALTATVALRVGLPTGGGVNAEAFYVDGAGVFAVPGTV